MKQNQVLQLILFLSFYIFSFYATGQHDTIIFCKKNNNYKEFKLPLKDFEIKIKTTTSKRMIAIITDYSDSMITIKIGNNSREKNKAQKDYIHTISKSNKGKTFTTAQMDSIMIQTDNMLNSIKYSKEMKVNTNLIKFISVSNHNRKEKKKIMNTLDIISGATVLAMVLAPFTRSGPIIAGTYGVGLFCGAVDIMFENKRLNLKRRWQFKQFKKIKGS